MIKRNPALPWDRVEVMYLIKMGLQIHLDTVVHGQELLLDSIVPGLTHVLNSPGGESSSPLLTNKDVLGKDAEEQDAEEQDAEEQDAEVEEKEGKYADRPYSAPILKMFSQIPLELSTIVMSYFEDHGYLIFNKDNENVFGPLICYNGRNILNFEKKAEKQYFQYAFNDQDGAWTLEKQDTDVQFPRYWKLVPLNDFPCEGLLTLRKSKHPGSLSEETPTDLQVNSSLQAGGGLQPMALDVAFKYWIFTWFACLFLEIPIRMFFRLFYNPIIKRWKRKSIQKQIAQLPKTSTLQEGICTWWYVEHRHALSGGDGEGPAIAMILLAVSATTKAIQNILDDMRRKVTVHCRITLNVPESEQIHFSTEHTFYDTRYTEREKINPLEWKLPLTVERQMQSNPPDQSSKVQGPKPVYVVKDGEQYIILPKNKQVKLVWNWRRRNNKT